MRCHIHQSLVVVSSALLSPEAIAAIENLCLSFLHQLAYDPKIQLNLADRKKIVSDGYMHYICTDLNYD